MSELDKLERQLIEQIEAITAEYKKAVHPYVQQLSNLRAMRPRVYMVDGQTMVPFESPDSATAPHS